MTEFGIDLSDFDWGRGPVDVASMARDGITFLTHKATEGTTVRHQHLADALGRARAAGVEFLGAYHVVRSVDVGAQVRWYLGYLDQAVPWWRTYPGFFHQIDLETWPYDNVSAAIGIAFAVALMAAQPKTVITYASRGEYGNALAADPTPLWNANYGANPTMHYREAYPGDGSARWGAYSGHTPLILQYGSQLTIGSQRGCDANAFRGSVAELRTLITGTHPNGATMTSALGPAEENWLNNAYAALLTGGPSCGEPVPDPINTGAIFHGNSVIDLLQHIRHRVDAPAGVPAQLTDAQVAALGAQIGAHLDARLDQLVALLAQAAKAGADVLAPPA